MSLNQPTINTLQALYSSMDKQELDESLDLLMDEAFKREWEEEYIGEYKRKEKL